MKLKGIPTSKRNPCGVCGNTHGCKILEDSWHFCLRCTSQQDAQPGYRLIKQLGNGMGGLFAPDNGGDEWSDEHRQKRLKEQELKRRQRETEEAKRRTKLLSIEERDHQYRRVNQNLTLTAGNRQVLRERGLTDTEINFAVELGAIRTWNSGQRIFGVSLDLAGINPLTRCLAGVDGIAIYALDPDGNITGAQLKPNNQDFGKYIWLSSQSKDGNGPQLPNGEVPLFTWKHPDAKTITKVWLCEGAFKSLIAALKLWSEGRTDIALIGTASAARYSEQTLRDYLKRLGTKTVQLMPDTGSLLNPNVTQANQDTTRHLRKWGYSVRVGNWEQLFQKSHLDIDELLVAGHSQKINFLTTAEFQIKAHWGNQIQKFLKSEEFHLVGDNTVELRATANSLNKWEQIKRYHSGIKAFHQGGYFIRVAWDGETLRPENFFALCDEGIQKQLSTINSEWSTLYQLKLWTKRIIEHYRPKLGFGKQIQSLKPKTAPATESIDYKPGKLPRPSECEHLPVIKFKPGQRLQVYQEAITAGWKHVLDKSRPGTWKSYDAGVLTPDTFNVKQIFYFSPQHRNPTVETIEGNFRDMPVRTNGMRLDKTRKTPLGQPHVI